MGQTSQKNVRNPNHHYFSKNDRNTPPTGIAIRLQCVSQYSRCPYVLRKENTVSTTPICITVRLPCVLQYASHLYRSTFGKIFVIVVTGMFPRLWNLFAPDRVQNPQNREKRAPEPKKPFEPFPPTPEKGVSSQKNPHTHYVIIVSRNGDF